MRLLTVCTFSHHSSFSSWFLRRSGMYQKQMLVYWNSGSTSLKPGLVFIMDKKYLQKKKIVFFSYTVIFTNLVGFSVCLSLAQFLKKLKSQIFQMWCFRWSQGARKFNFGQIQHLLGIFIASAVHTMDVGCYVCYNLFRHLPKCFIWIWK